MWWGGERDFSGWQAANCTDRWSDETETALISPKAFISVVMWHNPTQDLGLTPEPDFLDCHSDTRFACTAKLL